MDTKTIEKTSSENKNKHKKMDIKNKHEKINIKNKNEEINIKTNNENNSNKNKKTRIYSYNSRGFDITKKNICKGLGDMDKSLIPIICNQENFVLKGNGHLIRKALPEFHVFIKAAKKDRLEGRPINGMFIAIPKEHKHKAKDVSPRSERIQGIVVETEDENILIINPYFPPDPKTTTYS